ncbi:AbiJ-NTD4 domain-containing protein [Tabrizicola sp.]|uniref:AbiJ-NTD4 domain-containing protein n=1 Tax=Tabrizicola sp. TaxID=2005166 RepID=UPI0025DE881D|nr:hypothetical protein [Tabrizicola sp.]
MSWFSERFGHKLPPTDLKEEEMPESLISALWDILCEFCLYPIDERDIIGRYEGYSPNFDSFTRAIWGEFLRKPFDTRPQVAADCYKKIRELFFAGKFYERYDIVEMAGKLTNRHWEYYTRCNTILERERAAFRFADDQLVRISDPIELDEVEQALTVNPAEAVRAHIQRAAELYSDRRNPDYRNSIKESISAVEAAVSFISGKRSVGVSRHLQEVLADEVLHPALRQGFEKLYAYTSDAEGIRHSLMEDGRTITQEDARYMLISCSAFANYLIALSARRS